MTTSYLLLGFLALVVGPWSGAFLEAFMAVPYGFLALILLASLSFEVSLNPDYSEKIADGWASEWGISVSNEPSLVAPATRTMDTVLKETTVRPEIHRGHENQVSLTLPPMK
jgi:hypothetical protein